MNSQTADPFTPAAFLEEYLASLSSERWLSQNTVDAYRRDLSHYLEYLVQHHQGLTSPPVLDQYLAYLYEQGWQSSTIARRLAAVRGFHQFLVEEGRSTHDPTRFTQTPRVAASLPKALQVHEAIRLVEAPPVDTGLGRRDRALLETLYSTGARVSEVVDLDAQQLDLDTSTAMVMGKGGKQRLVPLGRPAVQAISDYLPDRLELRCSGNDSGALFLSRRGRRLTRQAVFLLVRKYATLTGLPAGKVSPHVLRHSAATHMVEGGADLRVVQEILGHANVSTTQVYTKMSLQHLQEVYVGAHPRALRRGLTWKG